MSADVTPDEAPATADVLDRPDAGGKAIRGGTLRAGGYVAGALITLVSVPLLVRHLGVVDFGRYVTVISLLAIVSGITDAGLGSVALREYAVLPGRARWVLMRDLLGARLALTTAGVLGAIAFAVVAGYPRVMLVGAGVAGLGVLVVVVQATYAVPLLADLRLGWVSAGDVLRSVLAALMVVGLILAGAGLLPFLAVSGATTLVLLALTTLFVRGRMPLVPAFHPSRWWRVLRETLPLAAATAVGTLYFRMAIVVMSLIATGLQTGYFAASYRLIEALAGLPVMLIGVTFPILARAAQEDGERLRFAVQRVFEVGLIGGLWMTIATAVGAGFAIQVIGGADAAPAAGVLRVQALYLIPLFLNLTWQTTLLALRMHREMLVSALGALVVVLALTLTLIPTLEARGAAVAVVVGETILAVLEGLLLWRAHPHLRPGVRILPGVLAAGLAAAATGIAVPAHDVVKVAAATIVYAAILLVTRSIPSELLPALTGGTRMRPRRS